MRLALTTLVALAACSRTPSVDLPVCSSGVAIEANLQHSLVIDAAGRMTIDGVACATEQEAQAALDRMTSSMHRDEALSASSGRRALDEPIVVRIDQATRFAVALHWLREVRYSRGMYRTRIAVREEGGSNEICLAIDTNPPRQTGDGPPVPCDPLTDKASGRVEIFFMSGEFPWWNKASRTPAWYVRQHAIPCDYSSSELTSWNEVSERVLRVSPSLREFGIDAELPLDTPWRDVVVIVAEAISLLHAEVEFY